MNLREHYVHYIQYIQYRIVLTDKEVENESMDYNEEKVRNENIAMDMKKEVNIFEIDPENRVTKNDSGQCNTTTQQENWILCIETKAQFKTGT